MRLLRGYSSAGRALEWHSRGQRFDPAYLHQTDSTAFCGAVCLHMGQGDRTADPKREAFFERSGSVAKQDAEHQASQRFGPAYLHQKASTAFAAPFFFQ